MERVSVGLLGLGTVGSGVARLLFEHERPDRPEVGAAGRGEMGRGPRRRAARSCPIPRDRIVADVRKDPR